jgi:hypothetical protein
MLACHAAGGETWKRWSEPMKRAVVDTQVLDRESCRFGSWNPVSGPAAEMGRLATTAFCILSMEVYYRYARVLGSRDPVPSRVSRGPAAPSVPSPRLSNRSAALDPDFPEPRTGFLR